MEAVKVASAASDDDFDELVTFFDIFQFAIDILHDKSHDPDDSKNKWSESKWA